MVFEGLFPNEFLKLLGFQYSHERLHPGLLINVVSVDLIEQTELCLGIKRITGFVWRWMNSKNDKKAFMVVVS